MGAYIIRTTLFKLVTLFIISIVSFLIIHLAPGEPSQIDPLNPRFTQEDLARYRAAFDLDKPLPVQYWLFYKKFFTGELTSLKDNQPVFGKIWRRFLISLPLFIVGTIITWCLSFPLGIAGALRRYTFFDRSTTFMSYLMISMPSFFLAYILIIAVVQGFTLPFIDYRVPGLEVSVLGIETFGRGRLLSPVQNQRPHLASRAAQPRGRDRRHRRAFALRARTDDRGGGFGLHPHGPLEGPG